MIWCMMPCLSVATFYTRNGKTCRHPRPELRNLSLSDSEAYQSGHNPHTLCHYPPVISPTEVGHAFFARRYCNVTRWCRVESSRGTNLLNSSSTSNFYIRTNTTTARYIGHLPSYTVHHRIRVITAALFRLLVQPRPRPRPRPHSFPLRVRGERLQPAHQTTGFHSSYGACPSAGGY